MTQTSSNALSINRISELSGVDRRALKRRLTAAGLSGGPWPVGVVLKALLASPGADPELAAAHRRRALARARLAELEAGKMAGELGSVAEWSQTVSVVIIEARRRLLAVPAKVASAVAYLRTESEVEVALDMAIREALTELSKPLFTDANSNGEAARPHNEREL